MESICLIQITTDRAFLLFYYLYKMTQSHWLLCLARVTRRGMKASSESRIQQRNLQIWKKMLEKSSPFLQSKQPCVLKSLEVALNIVRSWKNTLGKLAVAVNLEAFWIESVNERSVSAGWNFCLLWPGIRKSVWFKSRRHILAGKQLAVSSGRQYFARCCALKRTGTFSSERMQGYASVYFNWSTDILRL